MAWVAQHIMAAVAAFLCRGVDGCRQLHAGASTGPGWSHWGSRTCGSIMGPLGHASLAPVDDAESISAVAQWHWLWLANGAAGRRLAASGHLPGWHHPRVWPRGQRPGAPQAAQRHLLDTKTIYAGTTYYTVGARAAEDQSGAVETRAARVHGDYRRHAEQLDQRIGMPGQPIQTRLESFGTVRGAVFGNYGEASADVHSLLRVAAEMQARRMWRVMGARTWSEAFGFILQSMRRRLGVVVVREFARHRLHRVPYIGHTRASLARARSHAELQVAAMHAGPALGIRWEDFYAQPHPPALRAGRQAGVARVARGW